MRSRLSFILHRPGHLFKTVPNERSAVTRFKPGDGPAWNAHCYNCDAQLRFFQGQDHVSREQAELHLARASSWRKAIIQGTTVDHWVCARCHEYSERRGYYPGSKE